MIEDADDDAGAAPRNRGSFEVDEWCEYRRVSKPTLYRMWDAGTGPRRTWVGIGPQRKKPTISIEADREWLEANTEKLVEQPAA